MIKCKETCEVINMQKSIAHSRRKQKNKNKNKITIIQYFSYGGKIIPHLSFRQKTNLTTNYNEQTGSCSDCFLNGSNLPQI